ncbi:MAG: glycosyltransferase [Candidatus Auribacterota bacterium]|nr:glycosyltransferase [Candidatus Auribacterota bacterium]
MTPHPRFSVVIPNMNGGDTLRETLKSIFSIGYQGMEVIVVDDASSDNSPLIADEFPVRLIRHDLHRGAAASRNDGAAAARGEILLFLDADIIIPPDTFRIIERQLSDPTISGVIGLLQPVTRFKGFCSQYKNYYMHYAYLKLPDRVSVFYTSIAAIRKEVFDRCGGFENAYRGATIEDLEFGLRVTEQGYRIILDKNLQVEHLKKYGPAAILKTGFLRASGVAKIMLRDRIRRRNQSVYHTAPASFIGGIILAVGVLLLLPGVIFTGSLYSYLAALICYIVIIILNAGLLIGLAQHTRPSYFFLGSGMIFLDLIGHGMGIVYGTMSYLRGKRY